MTMAAFTLAVTPALASEPRVVVAGVSPVPSADKVVNRAITASFDVVLRQPHEAALTSYIASLSDTASPDYHHYLTPAQFAKDFGATASSVSSVRSYLSGYGLGVGGLSKGHVLLHVKGLTTDIARAFDASVETVRTSDGVLAAQFTAKATIPSSLARDVTSVDGLSTVTSPSTPAIVSHAASRSTTAQACPSAGSGTGTTPNSLGGYTVQQQAQLYGLSTAYASGDTGVGQTIAVYELGQYDQSDLGVFFTCYALTPSITPITVDSGISAGYNVGSSAEEATLDVEESAALAPGATIDVYEGPNSANGPTDIYQQIADNNTATIVTTSWGTCEGDPSGDATAEQAIFEQMAAQGQTVVAAAGDSGSSDCAANSDGFAPKNLAVDDPASQPFVTGVGGLSISSISPFAETVWNAGTGSGGAGGGGASTLWSRPSWQSAPGITAADTMRMVPDLSVMADPNTGFIEYFTGSDGGLCHRTCGAGWSSIGGTSIGSPLVSSLVAVAAQSCAVSRLGFINPTLYSMATAGVGFNDVTTGNNDLYNAGGYGAGVGYDMASGLGSPAGPAFIDGLCPAKLDAAKSAFTTSSQSPPINSPATITAVLRNSSSTPVANAMVDLSATAASGTIVIDGDASSTTSAGAATYQANSNSSGTASFTVTSNTAGPVVVTITYASATLYTTTLNFTAAASTTRAPGKPTIRSLRPLAGGFKLVVAPPASNGGSAITLYQYSINSGKTWSNISRAARSVTVGHLSKVRTYVVVVRARNVVGTGATSAASRVTTLA